MTQDKNTLQDILVKMGETASRMIELNALEASAGNLSVFVRQLAEPEEPFEILGDVMLPTVVPALAGGWMVVTGTGRRLRDLARYPAQSACALKIHTSGQTAVLYAAGEVRPTSEFNSHLAIHNDHPAELHTVLHTHPPYLTYISHLPAYADTHALNRRLMRWEPETMIFFPDGIGVVPFELPGSDDLMQSTLAGLRRHRAVVWCRHGLMTRSEVGIREAGDMVEFIEAAAHFEYLNLLNPNPVEGLSDADLCRIAERLKLNQTFFQK